MSKKSTFLYLFAAICLVCVSLSAQTGFKKEPDIFLRQLKLLSRSENHPSNCKCGSDAECCDGKCSYCNCVGSNCGCGSAADCGGNCDGCSCGKTKCECGSSKACGGNCEDCSCSGCSCEGTSCQGTCTECACQNQKGLKTCICADITSTDGYYDWRYMKAHCHDISGTGCADEYDCSGSYSWKQCSE